MYFMVKWHQRENGTYPLDSYVSHEEIKRCFPLTLLDFYESKIKVNK
jgi:hypothetical protein